MDALANRDLATSSIKANPLQPRRFFDEGALEELAASIREHGILQPLVVRPDPTNPACWLLIAGERRLRAARSIGLEMVPARILESVSDEQAFVLALLENVARQDMTVIEEANAYAQLLATGKSLYDLVRLVGKSAAVIEGRLALLRLRDDVQHLVARGQLSQSAALALATLDQNGQAEVLRKWQDGAFRTDAEMARFCQAVRAREAQSGLFEQDVMDAAAQKQRRVVRSQFEREMAKLAALTTSFQAVLELDPGLLAAALEAEVHAASRTAEEVARLAGRVRQVLLEAVSIYEANRGAVAGIAQGDGDLIAGLRRLLI